ncbi:SH3 domain-containing YSC84-like protein 1 isoform X2 [Kryptolebias marmoratus]|uniref:SH3 domain-containing YSC84-like protein 1 isoform X2 n=1 Tax=Kryptolebias marmoratus TaxID=37003 RepID=UPI000D52F7AD|nr:SH3 domain-containing YSC84-like protein 1 isoform X2 [Kryptolebias marmoratus]
MNPLPTNLKSETKKAAKILSEFTQISHRTGPDKLIPPHIIAKAEGLALISVIKAGFMVTARGGSGIVIARLHDRRWSAPSAIGIAGLGGGFEIGLEVSDLVIILNQRRAVDAFTKGGNLTLGGNCTVAVGPLGRNIEADVALRSTAAVFTYCRSRGLFAGISLEGSYLMERKETNRKFYGRDIRASAILMGDVEPPGECYDLYHILDMYTKAYTTDWTNKNMGPKSDLFVSAVPGRSIQTSTSIQAELQVQPPAACGQFREEGCSLPKCLCLQVGHLQSVCLQQPSELQSVRLQPSELRCRTISGRGHWAAGRHGDPSLHRSAAW